MGSLKVLADEIVACTKCPRLVEYLAELRVKKRKAYAEWDYWARPVPGFGDPDARLLVVGLAPGAHGAGRTGRVFTGDSSGDFLFPALHRAGFASQTTSETRDDGLTLTDCWISLAARCAPPDNKPLPEELTNCRPYLVRELSLLANVKVIVALGQIAFDQILRAVGMPRPKPVFAHDAAHQVGGYTIVTSYHPSRQNTQTGLLTPAMFDAAFRTARRFMDGGRAPATARKPRTPARSPRAR